MLTREDIDNAIYTVHIVENEKLRAIVDVELCNFILIRNFKIYAHSTGALYVSNPCETVLKWDKEKQKKVKYNYGLVSLHDHELRQPLITNILKAYGKHFQERQKDNIETLNEMNYTYKPTKLLDKKF